MTTKSTVDEYPQIRTMFADALKAMAEGETEAEKQIVYVLNEARAALPCPSFVGGGFSGSRHLFVALEPGPVAVVGVTFFSETRDFQVVFPLAETDGVSRVSGTLALADAVARALKTAHTIIAQAAMEAGPKVRTEYAFSMSPEGMSREVAACFAETAKAREVAPGETVKSADVLVLRARARVLEMRATHNNVDSDFCAGVKEACDAIGEALDMRATPETMVTASGFAGVRPLPETKSAWE